MSHPSSDLTPQYGTGLRLSQNQEDAMTAEATLTIGLLPKEAGVGVETLRFYERKQLITEPPRRASGYLSFVKTPSA